MRSWLISPLASSPTTRPSRSTTTRSAQACTSFRRCEMKMTLTPSAFRPAITCIRRSVSVSVRLEVGSSMMTSREFSDSALTISSSWRCAIDMSATGVSGLKSTSRRSQQRLARRRAACLRSTSFSGPPCSGSRPMKTLAATSRLSNRLSSWWTKAMPAAIASATLSDGRSTPSTRRWPAVGAATPPRTFISVDLPAPFSPIRPTTSPWRPTG